MRTKFYIIGMVLMTVSFFGKSQGLLCDSAILLCPGTVYIYNPRAIPDSAEFGANYGCLPAQQYPIWFYLEILNPGAIEIEIVPTPAYNINFVCWGPFTSPTTPCVAQLTAGPVTPTHAVPGPSPYYPTLNMIDCSYSIYSTEYCYIPNGITGQYYILMLTNYSNQYCTITFTVNGTGTLNCPPVSIQEETTEKINDEIVIGSYPNPFYDKTTLDFSLPKDTYARLDIYNIVGRHIATLFDDDAIKDKTYSLDFYCKDKTEGMYIYKLTTDEEVFVGKMTMIKN